MSGCATLSCEYENARRVTYDVADGGQAVFVPTCVKCHRFVKADAAIAVGDSGLSPKPNATCANCGRTHMHFEGFL